MNNANSQNQLNITDFELQHLISSSYEASIIVAPTDSTFSFFLNISMAEMPLNVLLSKYKVFKAFEFLKVAEIDDKIAYAIKFGNDPELLASILENLTQFDAISALKMVFNYHVKSERLYDWIFVLVERSKTMDFEDEIL